MTAGHLFQDKILAELWFVDRLRQLGRPVFTGDTKPEIRKERIRKAIIDGKIELAIIGKNRAGKTETFETAFARFYGEPLIQKSPRKAAEVA